MVLPAYLLISVFSVGALWISIEDFRTHTVRNRDLAVMIGLLVPLSWWVSPGWALISLAYVWGGLAYFVIYAVLGRIAQGQLGSGDYWGAGLLGIFLGALAPETLVIGWAVPFALGFIPAVVVWLRKSASHLPFLPFILFSPAVTVGVSVLANGSS